MIKTLNIEKLMRGERNNHEIVACEIAPTGKAKCDHCRNKIPEGTPKIWFYVDWNRKIEVGGKKDVPWKMRIKRGVCYKCSGLKLEYEISKQKTEINRLKLLQKKFNETMKNPKMQTTIQNIEILEALK